MSWMFMVAVEIGIAFPLLENLLKWERTTLQKRVIIWACQSILALLILYILNFWLNDKELGKLVFIGLIIGVGLHWAIRVYKRNYLQKRLVVGLGKLFVFISIVLALPPLCIGIYQELTFISNNTFAEANVHHQVLVHKVNLYYDYEIEDLILKISSAPVLNPPDARSKTYLVRTSILGKEVIESIQRKGEFSKWELSRGSILSLHLLENNVDNVMKVSHLSFPYP